MSVDGAKGIGGAISGITDQGKQSMDAAQKTTEGEMESVRDANAAGQQQSQAVNPANQGKDSGEPASPRDATTRANQDAST